jgi:hypothetical protein
LICCQVKGDWARAAAGSSPTTTIAWRARRLRSEAASVLDFTIVITLREDCKERTNAKHYECSALKPGEPSIFLLCIFGLLIDLSIEPAFRLSGTHSFGPAITFSGWFFYLFGKFFL